MSTPNDRPDRLGYIDSPIRDRVREHAMQALLAWELAALGDVIARERGWSMREGLHAMRFEAMERFHLGYREALSLSVNDLHDLFSDELANTPLPARYCLDEVRKLLLDGWLQIVE